MNAFDRDYITKNIDPRFDGLRVRGGFDGIPNGFTDTQLNEVFYRLTASKIDGYLILESPSFDEIDDFYNPGEENLILEAVTIARFSQADKRMAALVRVLNKNLSGNEKGIEAQTAIIGKPKKSGDFAYATVQIPFSDGQKISMVFHSPEGDKKKIGPGDSLVAFRWLVNKRDITHVVSPESGKDVDLITIAKRISQILIKNHDKFVKTQKGVEEEKNKFEELMAAAQTMEAENQRKAEKVASLEEETEKVDQQVTTTETKVSKQQAKNAELEADITALRAQQSAKNVGGSGEEGSFLKTKFYLVNDESKTINEKPYDTSKEANNGKSENEIPVKGDKLNTEAEYQDYRVVSGDNPDIDSSGQPVTAKGGHLKKRLQEIQTYLSLRDSKSADELLDIEIENDLDWSDIEDYEVIGIRYHKKGLADGQSVPKSFEHHDGEGHKEMSSTSTIWINKDTDINRALHDAEGYNESGRELILVGGNDWGAGLDTHTNERQIESAVKIPWISTKKFLPEIEKVIEEQPIEVDATNIPPYKKMRTGIYVLSKEGKNVPQTYTNNKQADSRKAKLEKDGFDVHVTPSHPFQIIFDKPEQLGIAEEKTPEPDPNVPAVKSEIIYELPVTDFRPEKIRVRQEGDTFYVETEREDGVWVVQQSHPSKEEAIADAEGMYFEPVDKLAPITNLPEGWGLSSTTPGVTYTKVTDGDTFDIEITPRGDGLFDVEKISKGGEDRETTEAIDEQTANRIALEMMNNIDKGPQGDTLLKKLLLEFPQLEQYNVADAQIFNGELNSRSEFDIPHYLYAKVEAFALGLEQTKPDAIVETKATKTQIENITKNGTVWNENGENRIYVNKKQDIWLKENPGENIGAAVDKISDDIFLDVDSSIITHSNHKEHQSILKGLNNESKVGGVSNSVQASIDTLKSIIKGDFDSNTEALEDKLDEAADKLEEMSLLDKYDDLLNKAADKAAEVAVNSAQEAIQNGTVI